MAEWHIPWDYMDTQWTRRQLNLFVDAMANRLERDAGQDMNTITEEEFLKHHA